MYWSFVLLLTVTALYAGYNLLIKLATDQVPQEATSTILATISLQVTALATSLIFAAALGFRGGQTLALPAGALGWAIGAGLCIGAAEIAYFYLFRGFANVGPVAANLAIPTIVGGTVVITVAASWLVLREPVTGLRLLGAGLVVAGIIAMFAADSRAGA